MSPEQPTTTILVVDDKALNTKQLAFFLERNHYHVIQAQSGRQGLDILTRQTVDMVITDWLMPEMDGPEFINQVRLLTSQRKQPMPLSIMLTILDNAEARSHALHAVGVDAFVTKPYEPELLIQTIESCLNRLHQTTPPSVSPRSTDGAKPKASVTPSYSAKPSSPGIKRSKKAFPLVMIAASTGGPPCLAQILQDYPSVKHACTLLLQHGPSWLQDSLAESLSSKLSYEVKVASQGDLIRPGLVYLASGNGHLKVSPDGDQLWVVDEPPVNFVKPAADPLFESGAQAFGPQSIGVVITGLGTDGSQGAQAIAESGGALFIQSPDEAVAPYMPNAVLALGLQPKVMPISQLGQGVSKAVMNKVTQVNAL